MALRSRPVDPRDITVEESDPTYRVYFWADDGRYCREYDVDGVDVVDEVIAWADANVRTGKTYILGVRWPEQFTPPGSTNSEMAFIRLKFGDAESFTKYGGCHERSGVPRVIVGPDVAARRRSTSLGPR